MVTLRSIAVGIVIGVLGTVVATVVLDVPKWAYWDRFNEPEPMDVPVVLSTQLSFDEGGAYTGEIRRALEEAEFGYRIIKRIFPSYDTVVPSTVRLRKVRTEAKRIMDDHGGDVLVYGAVGAKPNTISIRFFGREPGGYIERGIEIDLGDVAWSELDACEGVVSPGLTCTPIFLTHKLAGYRCGPHGTGLQTPRV